MYDFFGSFSSFWRLLYALVSYVFFFIMKMLILVIYEKLHLFSDIFFHYVLPTYLST